VRVRSDPKNTTQHQSARSRARYVYIKPVSVTVIRDPFPCILQFKRYRLSSTVLADIQMHRGDQVPLILYPVRYITTQPNDMERLVVPDRVGYANPQAMLELTSTTIVQTHELSRYYETLYFGLEFRLQIHRTNTRLCLVVSVY